MLNLNTEDKFVCPSCRQSLPFMKSFLLTPYSEIKCPYCESLLKPIESSIPHFGIIAGLLGGLIGICFYQSLGIWTAIPVFFTFTMANCWVIFQHTKFEVMTRPES